MRTLLYEFKQGNKKLTTIENVDGKIICHTRGLMFEYGSEKRAIDNTHQFIREYLGRGEKYVMKCHEYISQYDVIHTYRCHIVDPTFSAYDGELPVQTKIA